MVTNKDLTEIYDTHLDEIKSSVNSLKSFFDTAGRNYKYNFNEQLMIHAQKPESTACAELDMWNRLGLRVKKGSKSIRLFEINGENFTKKYIFDISDTYSPQGKKIKIWKLEEKYQNGIADLINEKYNSGKKGDFYESLRSLSDRFTDDIKYGISENIDFSEENLDEEKLINAVKNSVYYIAMKRFENSQQDLYFKDSDFEELLKCDAKDFRMVGGFVSLISEACISYIKSQEKELKKLLAKQEEKENVRDFIQQKRQVSGAEHRTAEKGEKELKRDSSWGQILADEAKISTGERQVSDRTPDNERSILGTLGTDGKGRTENDEQLSGENGEKRGYNRADEDRRPTQVGRTNEQHQESSRRDSLQGADLHLDKISPAEVDLILVRGSNFRNSKIRIFEWFRQEKSKAENIDFLKNEYGTGGSYPAISELDISEDHSSKGIEITKGRVTNPTAKINLSWSQVEKRLRELISEDKYLSKEEKEEIAKRQQELEKENENAVYTYKIGDEIFVNAKAYKVHEIKNDEVVLQDPFFPLSLQKHTKKELNTLLSQSSRNDKFKVLTDDILKNRDTFASNLADNEFVWTYYNPDSTSGGQFVVNYIGFNDIILAKESTQTPEDFFDYLAENCKQELVGKGTVDYPIILRDFMTEDYDFEGCTEKTRDSIYKIAYDEINKSKQTPEETVAIMEAKTDGIKKENIIDLSQYIGTEIELDKRKFTLDNVSGDYVSLRDKTFENSSGFPIFRQEYTSLVKLAIDEKIKNEAKKERKNIPANNFKIEGEISESLPPSVRLENNIKAIKTLKTIEKEKRNATADEQKILSRYVGWGGLSEVFNEDNKHYNELKNLLSEKEYKSARASTLTAFYTPSVVINSMYKALENAGFNTGNILEPSCGVGNFMGLLPESMSDSKLYGVELDNLSGRIAKKLYPKNNIQIKGFEKANFPDNFFDVAIGNIPFGNYQVYDKDFKNNGFMIHDFFVAKALEKVRPGGVVAFVTSKGTLDKKDSKVREYLAQRADLVGAVRLPDNTFKGSAGTEVTSDIIFLQKRENLNYEKQAWTEVLTDENGVTMNSYFVSNPQMILGEMKEVSTRFGKDFACKEVDGKDLSELLSEALKSIKIENHFQNVIENNENEREIIPAEADVNNFSYTIKDDKLYFRENSIMRAVTGATATTERIKGMIKLRDTVRDILDYQISNQGDEQIKVKQKELNTLYDNFTKKYGLINSNANKKAFNQDDGYFLLCSLENLDENGKLQSKADIFTKRTMNVYKEITHTDTSSEALTVSISEKACVDLGFMSELTNKPKSKIIGDLKGIIYRDFGDYLDKEKPFKIDNFPYVTSDEYLSGNIRKKLACVKELKRFYPEFSQEFDENISGLKNVMPEELTATDIHVKLGSTWVPTTDVRNFIFETLNTPFYHQYQIKVTYSQFNSEWRISGKNLDRDNIAVYSTYGTKRVNAYKIIENTLNMRSVKVYDKISDDERVLNVEQTRKAQLKQELVKEKFSNWVFENPARRERLCKIYNEKFNSIRPREYDGSHIVFRGMNAEIKLRQHQLNAVAHALYGGNTLLAHVVGGGKTFEMTAIAQESKRLGLCHKSLIAVPNYLTEQWAKEYLQLYPNANIIVATKKDFEKANRKKFCAKIATGNYDAVIIGHSQLVKIPLSEVRQKICLQREIDDLEKAVIEAKEQRQERVAIKDLERSKKSLEKRLEKLNNNDIKDDVVTFEELGVDRLFIDESHAFKNLATVSKMRNIAGVAQSESQRALDLYMKCQYINEITENKGVIFATGTPLSNSMSELYTIQKYLQYDTLKEHGIQNFDAWASTFGEITSSMELDPTGTGFRMKTRFSKFYNLPELMSMFKEVADIKTADVLNLPTPEAVFENIVVKPTELQKEMILSLGDRAEKVRSRQVDVRVDNMLLITNDGRKIALDQRLYDDTLPDTENNKSSMCANKMFEIWEETKEQKSTQICFCDLSTPRNDGSFNIYDDIKNKLIKKGVPEEEIAFIHNAKNEEQRKKLFEQVRKGNVRFIFGSTAKLGAGANIQNKLIALHHLEAPWRSSDLLQREGRIVRQGNENEKVYIYRYVTEGSFDSYIFQLIENKQRFSSQIMTSKAPVRAAEDIDEVTLSYSEVKALATGNPKIQERCNLEAEVNKLKLLKADYLNQKYVNEDKLIKYYPTEIKNCQEILKGLESDKILRENAPKATEKHISPMIVNGVVYTKKEEAGNAIIANMNGVSDGKKTIGEYKGFTLRLSYDIMKTAYVLDLQGKLSHRAVLGKDAIGNITRIDNALGKIEEKIKNANERLNSLKTQEENAKILIKEPFKDEQKLSEKSKRLKELDAELKIDFNGQKEEEKTQNSTFQTPLSQEHKPTYTSAVPAI